MIRNITSTPLGFSDLVDDEAFVITVFRRWQSQGDVRNIARSLRNEKSNEVIPSLFDLFDTTTRRDKQAGAIDSLVLTELEEDLLTQIGSKVRAASQFLEKCRQNLEMAGMTIRPARNIPRSGHDYLVEVIDRKATKVFELFHGA